MFSSLATSIIFSFPSLSPHRVQQWIRRKKDKLSRHWRHYRPHLAPTISNLKFELRFSEGSLTIVCYLLCIFSIAIFLQVGFMRSFSEDKNGFISSTSESFWKHWGQWSNCTNRDYPIPGSQSSWGITSPAWLVAGRSNHPGPGGLKSNKILGLIKVDIHPNPWNQTGPLDYCGIIISCKVFSYRSSSLDILQWHAELLCFNFLWLWYYAAYLFIVPCFFCVS